MRMIKQNNNHNLLARLEREDKLLLTRLEVRMDALQSKFDDLIELVEEMKKEIKNDVVSQHEFKPIKNTVYAAIGMILSAFMLLLFQFVFGSPISK